MIGIIKKLKFIRGALVLTIHDAQKDGFKYGSQSNARRAVKMIDDLLALFG